jgi:hypothetical protein
VESEDTTYVSDPSSHRCSLRSWSELDREREIRKIAELDGKRIRIGIEQEPGSGGKESAESTLRNLAGWRVTADRPTGEKVVRAEPYEPRSKAATCSWSKALGTLWETLDFGIPAGPSLTLKAASDRANR